MKQSTRLKDYEFELHPPWFLLHGAEQIDIKGLFWNLEKTIEKNPEKWWGDSKCFCGEAAVFYQAESGYRCEGCRP